MMYYVFLIVMQALKILHAFEILHTLRMLHALEMHALEIHALEMHALDMYALEIWPSSTLHSLRIARILHHSDNHTTGQGLHALELSGSPIGFEAGSQRS